MIPPRPAAAEGAGPRPPLPVWAAGLLLAFVGLVPATRTEWVRIADVPISTKDLALIAVSVACMARAVMHPRTVWPWGMAKVAFALLAYAAVSMSWSSLTGRIVAGTAYTAIVAASAAGLGWALARLADASTVRKVLSGLTISLAALTALYSAESLLGLGLRSAADTGWTDFGIQRVRGPLFGSSTGGFVLVPALGYAMEMVLSRARHRLLWAGTALSLFVGLFGLGSRAALLALAVFLALTVTATRSAKPRLATAALLLVIGAAAGSIVFSRASAARLVGIEDDAREVTYRFARRVVARRDAVHQVIGSGYGRVWPWYLVDVETTNVYATGDVIQETALGETLYHPHSTVLLVGIELGAVGGLLLGALLMACLASLRRARRQGAWAVLASGVVAATAMMPFDLFLFKNPAVNACWWTYAFCSARLIAESAVEDEDEDGDDQLADA